MLPRNAFMVVLVFSLSPLVAQEGVSEQMLEPVGGKGEFEQVLETQLTLPELLLTKNFVADVKVNFSIDSIGKARSLVFTGAENNALRNELSRILGYFRFEANELPLGIEQPYYVLFNLSTTRYRKYTKQRSRLKIRTDVQSDSSLAIFTRADRSPVYSRNGDEGLAEFILGEISYPEVARHESVEGTVVLEFVVEPNGFVTGIVPRKRVGGGCTEEAIRLICQTRWEPAVSGGKAVRYRMNYPITFSLRNSSNAALQPAATVGN